MKLNIELFAISANGVIVNGTKKLMSHMTKVPQVPHNVTATMAIPLYSVYTIEYMRVWSAIVVKTGHVSLCSDDSLTDIVMGCDDC